MVFTTCLVSCQPPRQNSLLTIASAGKIKSLDPAQASTFDALQLLSALGDPLYRLSSKGKLEPRLASGPPKVTDNGLTITIPLRKNIVFHDGTEFNSAAMAFSLRRFIEIGTLNYIVAGKIDKIEIINNHTIRLRLTRPSSSLIGLLTSTNLTPVSPAAYQKHKDKFLNKNFIGTGPYQLKSFNSQQKRIEPFPHYWGDAPSNNGINFINLSNSTALYGALLTGEVDVLLSNSIDEDQRLALHKLSDQGKLVEGKGRQLEIGYITLLSNKAPLNNQLIRKALSYSLNRQLISKRVSYGLREPLRSLIPPSLQKFKSEAWPTYDPEKAKFLLAKAGYCNKKSLDLKLTFRSNIPADKLLAITWRSQLEKDLPNCINLSIEGIESTSVYRQLGEGNFEAVVLDWRGAYPDPEAYLTPLLSCNSAKEFVCEKGEASISGSFWTHPGLEQEIRRTDSLTGVARIKALNNIEQIAAKGSAYLPVWLVTPKAWAQVGFNTPKFDGAGNLQMHKLKVID
ncbi:ABC transporter substrate-binding protein [Prochlorococcus sp. MIT 1300]|uniref:ABC transporter substrate-binding protein n=1 Tax=Prochlorococcus sp. MIT 1300 TaxID=3096218 RepID=UPI002A752C58|nr:ABC transporter substrate-binding protein [Prochlorococcus sp. MIT 1300]